MSQSEKHFSQLHNRHGTSRKVLVRHWRWLCCNKFNFCFRIMDLRHLINFLPFEILVFWYLAFNRSTNNRHSQKRTINSYCGWCRKVIYNKISFHLYHYNYQFVYRRMSNPKGSQFIHQHKNKPQQQMKQVFQQI